MLCSICNQYPVVFNRIYSGEKLCQTCFIESIEKKVRKTISTYNMLKNDDRIAIALSGGKDSSVLLYILQKLEKKFPRASIFAVTVDEGINQYRDEAIQNAKSACRQLEVEHVTVSFKELFGLTLDDIAKRIKSERDTLTPCSYCGVLRRRALNKAAKEFKATKVAVGHTLDDEAQTILLNFIHGDIFRPSRITPTSGLKTGQFITRIKPICEIPEDEVALYAYFININFQSVVCPYASQALRTEIREFLNKLEENHPSTKYIIYRSFEKIKPMLKIGVSTEMKQCKICGEPAGKSICEPCRMLKKLSE